MITPHKGWIPANCQEVDGEWFFLIQWHDCPGGWRAKHDGKALFHPFTGPVVIVNKQLELFDRKETT